MGNAIISAVFAAMFLVAMSCALDPLPREGIDHVERCAAECAPGENVHVDFASDPPRCVCK